MTSADRPLAGIIYLICGLGVLVIQDVIMKLLSGLYPVWQFGVIRSVVAVGIIAAVLVATGKSAEFRPNRPVLIALRGVLLFCGYTCYYLAIASVPLAEASAIFVVAPLLLTALSVPVLGERVGARRWVAVVVGFVGVLVIIRPGFSGMQPALLIALGSPICYATMLTITRKVGQADTGATLTLFNLAVFGLASGAGSVLMLFMDPVTTDDPSLAFLTRSWALPTPTHLAMMIATGVVTAFGHWCSAQAYRMTPTSVLSPLEYTSFVWSVILGFIIWGHLPGALTFAGAAIVVLSGGYVMRREAVLGTFNRRTR